MLVKQQVYRSEVVAQVGRGHELLLLLDPSLLVGHVPVELPQLAALLQALAPLCGQLEELLVGSLQVGHAVLDHLWVAWFVVCKERG